MNQCRKKLWKLTLLAGGGLWCGTATPGLATAQEVNLAKLLPALEAPAAPDRLAAIFQIIEIARRDLPPSERRHLGSQLGPRLAKLATDRDARLQLAALEALGRLGVAAENSTLAYDAALNSVEVKPRQVVAESVATHLRTGLADLARPDRPGESLVLAVRWLQDVQGFTPICARLLTDRDVGIRVKTRALCDDLWQDVAKVALSATQGEGQQTSQVRKELPRTAAAWVYLVPALLPHLQHGPLPERLATAKAIESLAQLLATWEQEAVNWGLDAEQQRQLRQARRQLAEHVPAFVAVIHAAPPDLQLAGLAVLEALNREAEAARPLLMELTSGSKNSFIRWSCVRILGKLAAPRSPEPWNNLAQLLSDEDVDVRLATLRLFLAWAGEEANRQLAPVAHVTPHGTPFDRRPCVKAIADRLEKGTAREKQLVLEVLTKLGPEALPALPQLKVALTEAPVELRRQMPEVLRALGKPTQPLLETALTDGDEEVRLAAAKALQRLGK